ncbi:DUF6401 family natural product biosynthesis protein [Saccharomonospora sp. NPDC046836]|uniref:DUF6401 family natural product biosynthesis protein n=1 Tax=Saccharomonospora sp. NPDC046836 TaxID=3156921 RepID=UPI0033E0A5D3
MGWLDSATDRSARRWLSRMGDELRSGWLALAEPAVRKKFDQHLDQITEFLRVQEELVDRAVPTTPLVLIAGHAYDVRNQARDEGWQPPDTAAAWTADEWFGLRLLACYELAAREPRGPKPAHRHVEGFSIVGLIRGARPG